MNGESVEKKKRPAAVCVTVPHRALTAPRRVASLKSWLTPTCSTGGDADWSTPPATPAIGTTIKLSENFPRYIVRTSPTPTSVPCRGPIQRGEESGIRWSLEEGRERERERERKRETLPNGGRSSRGSSRIFSRTIGRGGTARRFKGRDKFSRSKY